jgi:hypothetical protein
MRWAFGEGVNKETIVCKSSEVKELGLWTRFDEAEGKNEP